MADKKIQIFVSSPGDVGEERLIAERVIRRLQGRFGQAAEIKPFLWEHEPMRATHHFQEEMEPEKADIVVCMLWWRLGTRLPREKYVREDGRAYESGTEYELEVSIKEYKKRGLPDLLVYRKKNAPVVPLNIEEAAWQQRREQKAKLDSFIARVFETATGELKRGWKDFGSVEEFEGLLEDDLGELIQRKLPEHVGEEGEGGVRWHRDSPFRGLKAFGSEDREIFFGRMRATGEVKEILLRQEKHFLLILAASGTGKSSLMRAGVLPLITQPGVIEGVGLWRSAEMRPGDRGGDLVGVLAHAIVGAVPELGKLGYASVEDFAEMLRKSPELAAVPLGAALRAAGEADGVLPEGRWSEVRLALGIDQLEEIFTHGGVTDGERGRFMDAVGALVESGWVWVIATMRSDFYAHCASVPKLATMKQGLGLYELLRPTGAEIGQMINNPAKAAGLRYETDQGTGENLSEVIRAAAVAGEHTLPLLEFLLDELYQQRNEAGMLTFEAYRRLRGLEGAITKRAEDEFELLSAEGKAAVPEVVRALITFRGGEQGLVGSRRVLMRELATTAERREVIERFVKARLLVQDRDERDEAIVGLAHESLLRHWGLVKRVVQEDMHFLRTRSRIAESMKQWAEEGRKGDAVLPEGKLLEEAGHLLGRRRGDLDREMERFVEESFCEHLRAGLASGVEVERRFERLASAGCGERCATVLGEAMAGGTAEVKCRAMEIVGRERVRGLEARLAELAVEGEEKRVRRGAVFCLARLNSAGGYDAVIGAARAGREWGHQALAYLLVAYEQQGLGEGFGEKFAKLPAGLRGRVRLMSWRIRLVEGANTIPYIVIPAAVFAAVAAGLWKWLPGMFGWALSQPNGSAGSGLFHGVTAGVIWSGTISFCLTLHSVVFRNRRKGGGLVRPFGAVAFGAVGGLVSGFLIVVVIVGVFQMDTLTNMGWIEKAGERQFGMEFWQDLFVRTRFGWAYTLTGMGLGAGMAMMTNLIRAKDRLGNFLQGREKLVGMKQVVVLVREIFRFVLPYAWPLPAAIGVCAVVVMGLLRPGAGAEAYAKEKPEVWPTALKARNEGRLMGLLVDGSAEALGGICGVVGIGLGIVVMNHGIQIQARGEGDKLSGKDGK